MVCAANPGRHLADRTFLADAVGGKRRTNENRQKELFFFMKHRRSGFSC